MASNRLSKRPAVGRLLDAVRELRNRVLAHPHFQRWAARFPLTRPIARRRAHQLFDLCAGFIYAQVVLACVRSGLLDALNDRAKKTASELAAEVDLPLAGAERLLAAAAALRIVEPRSGGRYGLGNLGAVLASSPGIRAMVEHHPLLYADLQDPLALLRDHGEDGAGTALGRYWAYAGTDRPDALQSEQVGPYSELMAASLPMVATEVLDAYSLRRHRRLLDVGGGEGAFLIAAARRWPHLRGQVVELPAVAQRARTRIAAAGLDARLDVCGADFFRDTLPGDADLVTLVRILLDHDDAAVLMLLRNLWRAMAPGATLLIAEVLSDSPGVERVGDAYFGIYLFAMGRGRPRSAAEIEGLLEQAGFVGMRLLPGCQPIHARVLIAQRPPA